MPDVLQPVDAIDQEKRQPCGKDVDGDPAHDLVRPKADRDHRMNKSHQAPRDDADQGREPWVVPGEVGDDGEEGASQHHAFHRDVDDTAPLGDDAAKRRQEQKHGSFQRRPPQVSGKQQVPDVGEEAHVTFAPSPGGALAGRRLPRLGNRSSRRKLAAMLNRIRACTTCTRLLDIPASACITEPPARRAPNKIDARRIPTALPRPRSATAMASNPVVSLKYLSERLWSTPAIWIAPASPENAPAISIVMMTVRGTLMPPYRAAGWLWPTARISYPSDVRHKTKANTARATNAIRSPVCTR